MTNSNSMFEFERRFGLSSPFGNWIEEDAEQRQSRGKLEVIRIEGPFFKKSKVEFVNRNQECVFYTVLNQKTSVSNYRNINWAVSFDDDTSKNSYYLFSGGQIVNGKAEVKIRIAKGKESFRIYSYTGNIPQDSVSVKVDYKQVVVFFIGGAGDKSTYIGSGPTRIIRNQVKTPFDSIAPKQNFKSIYLGYEEAYKDEIAKMVIPEIPNKKGTMVAIVGHSLGGWNGAHLSKTLTDKGYYVPFLSTLDPVGTKVGVTLISSIYWDYPNPPSNTFWCNILAAPEDGDGSDFIASLGGRWEPDKKKVNLFLEVDMNHDEAGKMFREPALEGLSTSEILLYMIDFYLGLK